MAVTKIQARKVRQPVFAGDLSITELLDASNTTEVVTLSIVGERMSVQSDGDLAGNLEISVNGATFESIGVFVAGVIANYGANVPDHLFKVIRVTRTGGSGRLHILVK